MKCIAYNGGYKYQLKQEYSVAIDIKPPSVKEIDYVKLDTEGNLTLSKGYAWDGPSGPTFDTLSFMRGSLVHDGLYQLMRECNPDHFIQRKNADLILRRICLEDGMWPLRAWWVYQGVRLFANPASDPASKRPSTRAPVGCAP